MGLSKDEIEVRVIEALSTVKELELADRPPHHLSEGEKRMVSIAAILAMRPQFMIYDEPSANLDIRSRRYLIRLLQKAKQTILIASHDLEFILEICNRIVIIDEGRIVADGATLDIMTDDKLLETHGQEKPHSLVPHQVRHPH
jgi:cobalt/nickel transport system ATP-binding protein